MFEAPPNPPVEPDGGSVIPVDDLPGEELVPNPPVDYSTSPFEQHPIDVIEEGAIDEQSLLEP